jgi:flagellar basal body-associated protein FliL
MKKQIIKISQISLLGIFTLTSTALPIFNIAEATSSKIVYPLQEISTLECRFNDFDTLSNNCKQKLPVLKTKDYKKYASQN